MAHHSQPPHRLQKQPPSRQKDVQQFSYAAEPYQLQHQHRPSDLHHHESNHRGHDDDDGIDRHVLARPTAKIRPPGVQSRSDGQRLTDGQTRAEPQPRAEIQARLAVQTRAEPQPPPEVQSRPATQAQPDRQHVVPRLDNQKIPEVQSQVQIPGRPELQSRPDQQQKVEYRANGQPEGPMHQQHYQEDVLSYSTPAMPPQDRVPSQNSQYDEQYLSYSQVPAQNHQYDERHQTQGQMQPQNNQYDTRYEQQGLGYAPPNRANMGQMRDKRRPPQMNLTIKTKPRQRILVDPVSPVDVSWDSPFPFFIPPKKNERNKYPSLERDLNNSDGRDMRSPGPRPRTSQSSYSHRSRSQSRPQTSQGLRRPEERELSSPLPPPSPMDQPHSPNLPPLSPVSPSQRGPPHRLDPSRPPPPDLQGPLGGAYPPPGRPMNPPTSMRYQNRPVAGPFNDPRSQFRPGQPQRSVTLPEDVMATVAHPPGPAHPPRQASFPGPGHMPGVQTPQAEHFTNVPTASDRNTSQIQRSRSNGSPGPHEQCYAPSQTPINVNLLDGEYNAPLPHDQVPYPLSLNRQNYGNSQQQTEREMPNFDHSAPSADAELERSLQTVQSQDGWQPPSQRKTSQQMQQPIPSSKSIQMPPKVMSSDSKQPPSPFEEFTFDFPNSDTQQYHSTAASRPTGNIPKKMGEYAPTAPQDDSAHHRQMDNKWNQFPQRNPSQMQEFPIRSASRFVRQPRYAGDVHQGPQVSASSGPPYGSGSPNKSGPRAFSNENGYPQVGHDHQHNDSYSHSQPRSQPQHRHQGGHEMGGGAVYIHRPGGQQVPTGKYPPHQAQPSSIPNSGNAPSSRTSVQPNLSDKGQSQYDQQSGPVAPPNPDALPSHPTPIRPGLSLRKTQDGTSAPPIPPPQQPASDVDRQVSGGPKTSQDSSKAEKRKSPPITALDLKILQQNVQKNPNDYKMALQLAKKTVEAASVLSSEGGTADAKKIAKNRERYVLDAHKIIKKLVSHGHPDAMFYLADCHGRGLLGLQKDAKEAFNLYQSAAKVGHAQAAYRVAVCCEMGADEGGGTKRDPTKAMQWYKRAATLGDTPAMYKLAMILLKGLLGQPKNPREALSWLKRAADRADKENPHALHELGLLYESAAPNDAIVRDEEYSRQLFLQAAELGYKYSQFRLGTAYEYGLLGCPADARQSISWYSRAAVQGEHQSELALSGWYLTGSEGILQQSDTEAYLWARKAASSGLAKAEYAMGYFTETGIGVIPNLDEAQRWYWRAASQNFPKAQDRLDELKKGGGKMQKTKVTRSAVNKQNEGECSVM